MTSRSPSPSAPPSPPSPPSPPPRTLRRLSLLKRAQSPRARAKARATALLESQQSTQSRDRVASASPPVPSSAARPSAAPSRRSPPTRKRAASRSPSRSPSPSAALSLPLSSPPSQPPSQPRLLRPSHPRHRARAPPNQDLSDSDSSDDFEPSPRPLSTPRTRALRDDRPSMNRSVQRSAGKARTATPPAPHPGSGSGSASRSLSLSQASPRVARVLTLGPRGRPERRVVVDASHSELSDSDAAGDEDGADWVVADDVVVEHADSAAESDPPVENLVDAVRRSRRARRAAQSRERAPSPSLAAALPAELAGLNTELFPDDPKPGGAARDRDRDRDASPGARPASARKRRVQACPPSRDSARDSEPDMDVIDADEHRTCTPGSTARKRTRRVSRILDVSSDESDAAVAVAAPSPHASKRVVLDTPPRTRRGTRSAVRRQLAEKEFAPPVPQPGASDADGGPSDAAGGDNDIVVISPVAQSRKGGKRNASPAVGSRVRKRRRIVESSSDEDGSGDMDDGHANEEGAADEVQTETPTPGHISDAGAEADADAGSSSVPCSTRGTTPGLRRLRRGSDARDSDPDAVIDLNDDSEMVGVDEPRTPSPRPTRQTRSRSQSHRKTSTVLAVTPPSTPSPPSTKRRTRLRRLDLCTSGSEDEGGAATTAQRPASRRSADGQFALGPAADDDHARKEEWFYERDIDEFSSSHSEERRVTQRPTPKKLAVAAQCDDVIEVVRDESDPKTDTVKDFSDEVQAVDEAPASDAVKDFSDELLQADAGRPRPPSATPRQAAAASASAAPSTTARATSSRPRATPVSTSRAARAAARPDVEVFDLVDDDDDDDDDFMATPSAPPVRAATTTPPSRRRRSGQNESGERVDEADDRPPALNLHAMCEEGESVSEMVERVGEEVVLQQVAGAQRAGRAIIGGDALGIPSEGGAAFTPATQQADDELFSRFSNTVVAAQMQRARDVAPVTEAALRGEFQFRYNGMERDGRGRASGGRSTSGRGGKTGGRGWWRGSFKRGRGRGRGRGGARRR